MSSDVRRGVYLLPNLLTTASLLCGFYSIIYAMNLTIHGRHNFQQCALAIIVAAIFDGLDGRVARHTKTSTRFGVEYDSLADLVSFGVAPALVLYLWTLRDLGRVGWLGAFLYLACGALRLARFNVQASGVEKKFFQGLPIPMAALMVSTALLIWEGKPVADSGLVIAGDVQYYILVMTYLLAGLMVSSIPYRSFKTLHLSERHPFYNLVMVVIALVIWATKPWWVLFVAGCAYLVAGPIEQYVLPPPIKAIQHVKRRRRVRKALDRLDQITSSGAPPSLGESPADGTGANSDENVRPLRRT